MFKRKKREVSVENKEDEILSIIKIFLKTNIRISDLTYVLNTLSEIGIHFGHEEIVKWSRNELTGYNTDTELPKYRQNVVITRYEEEMSYGFRGEKKSSHSFENSLEDLNSGVSSQISRWSDVTGKFYVSYSCFRTMLINIVKIAHEYQIILKKQDKLDELYINFLHRNDFINEDDKIKRLKFMKKKVALLFKFSHLPHVFYEMINKEITTAYRCKLYSAVRIFQRKFVENLMIDILRKKFPNDVELFFNTNKGRFRDFGELMDNIKNKIIEFKPYGFPDVHFIGNTISKFRKKGNSAAHSLLLNIKKKEIDADLPVFKHTIDILLEVFKNLP